MYNTSRNITKENFPVFKQLVEQVIIKTTGKPFTDNPFIKKITAKKSGKEEWHISEKRAKEEVADKVFDTSNSSVNNGRRFQTIINAVLNDDTSINAWLITLDALVKFVWQEKPEIKINTGGDGKRQYWRTYLEESKNHFGQDDFQMTNIHQYVLSAESSDKQIASTAGVQEGVFSNDNVILSQTSGASVVIIEDPVYNKETINSKLFIRAGKFGGACAGFIGAVIIAVARYISVDKISLETGYDNMRFSAFLKIFPVILLFQVLAGALLGWLCSKAILAKRNFIKNCLAFIVSFFIIILFRQSMARDAWLFPHLLGEPDFETIATGLTGSVAVFILVRSLRKRYGYILGTKTILWVLSQVLLFSTITWCSVYFIYRLLTYTFGILTYRNFFISPAIFTIDFPHPERAIFSAFLSLMYVYCIIAFLQYASDKMMAGKTGWQPKERKLAI